MKTDYWKTTKEENPAALCELQQMVLSAAPIIKTYLHHLILPII
jgi:hypothetical protein